MLAVQYASVLTTESFKPIARREPIDYEESPWRARVPRLAALLADCGACVVGVPRARRPLSIPPTWFDRELSGAVDRSTRPAPLVAAALRFARDRPFRAGFRSSRCGSCRASGFDASTKRAFGCVSLARRTRNRLVCWTLAPGGSDARCWLILLHKRSRSRPDGTRAKARARAQ